MDGYVLSAEEQAKVIRRSYNRTRAYVQSEIEKILHHVGDVDSPAYEYRMKRLASLLQNTEKRIKELYGITLEDTTSFLKSIIPEAYYHTIFDIAQGTGIEPSFAAVNEKLINAIVEEPWSGKNYSKRIWANTDKLSNELREVLTQAAMSGESISKTLRKVAESFNTSSYNAERLIRTETTYACNQAEIASYNELDIDRYKYVATLDTRTSPICQQLDGKIFETEKARAGLNLPAMHPNCRSTTIPYFEDFEPTERAARDSDGKPIRVPANMTYPEWYDKYVKPQEGQKTPQKPPKGNNTVPRPEPRKTPVRTPERAPAEIDIPAPSVGEPEYRDTAIPKAKFTPARTKEEATANTRNAINNAYEYHREHNDLSLVPISEIENAESVMPVNYGNLSDETAADFSNTLSRLMSEYDTPLNEIRVMTKEEYAYLNSSFASVSHDYSMNSAQMLINPVKTKDHDKLIEKLKNHRENGFIVDVPDDRINEYVATHEFGHSLLGMNDKLSNKYNFTNADYTPVKQARKEIEQLYDNYLEELRPLQEEFDKLSEEYFSTLDESVAEKLSLTEDKMKAIKISEYSLESPDEFLAEAFTQGRIGTTKTKYSSEVTSVLDKYFKRGT